MSGHFLPHLRPRLIALWHRVKGPARLALLALVVWKLGSALNAIGWGKLVHNLPAKPWFYAIFIINYLSLPFFEMIIYHWLWRTGPSVLPALLRKRVYNETVLEYSGETALFVWASNHTHVAEGKIFRDVRDVNILSAFVSNLATFLLLVAVFAGVANHLSGADALMLRHGVMLS